MSERELSIELGVASVYLEDELELLERYGFLEALSGGKLQTTLFIWTKAFHSEYVRAAKEYTGARMGEILRSVREKLPEIRKIGFVGSGLSDDRLLWAFLFKLTIEGGERYESVRLSSGGNKSEILSYGSEPYDWDKGYVTGGFGGVWFNSGRMYVTGANYGILPEKNRIPAQGQDVWSLADGILDGTRPADCVLMTNEQLGRILSLLKAETDAVGDLFLRLRDTAEELLPVHAPASVRSKSGDILAESLPWNSYGLLAGAAVRSGALSIPDFDGPLAMYFVLK